MKKAYTLAEIMIVLGVIGVLTAVTLSAARNVMPNEDVLNFKKAHNILHTAIFEAVISDRYFGNGYITQKPDTDDNPDNNYYQDDKSYLCKVLADIINVNSSSCTSGTASSLYKGYTKAELDTQCKSTSTAGRNSLTLNNGTVIYFFNDWPTSKNLEWSDATNKILASKYIPFCIDIGSGEDPFGYGLRVDGRMISGARADAWIRRQVQERE